MYPGIFLAALLWAPPDEIRKLVDAAFATPPEIAADALIRIASGTAAQDPAWAIELLNRAFSLADSAAHPYRRVGAVGAAQGTDTDAGRLSMALATGLDRNSLKIRAARALLRLDKAAGVEAFFRLGPPGLPPLTCRDAMVWRTGEYYDFVREVFDNGFTARQRQEGLHVAMLEDVVRSLSSPFQLEPLTRLLVQVQVTSPQLERLAAVYATSLKMLQADDRSFSSGTRHGFTQALHDLAARCRKTGLSPLPLLDAFKTYLQRGVRSKRCEDSAESGGEGAWIANMVHLLNMELKKFDQDPIRIPEKPDHVIPERAEVYVFWSSEPAKRLFEDLVTLQRSEDKTGEQWERLVRDYLLRLNEWEKDGREPGINYFHQRALLHVGLIGTLPAGSLRLAATGDFLRLLLSSPVERQSPPEWYMYARDLPSLAAAEEIRRTGHPGLWLMLELPHLLRNQNGAAIRN